VIALVRLSVGVALSQDRRAKFIRQQTVLLSVLYDGFAFHLRGLVPALLA